MIKNFPILGVFRNLNNIGVIQDRFSSSNQLHIWLDESYSK